MFLHDTLVNSSDSVFAPNVPANIDTRIQNNSDKQLVTSFASVRVGDNELPLRPGFGTVGREIKLRANFFPVRIPAGSLYEYDVAISPTAGTASRRVKKRIFQLAEDVSEWTQRGLKGIYSTSSHRYSCLRHSKAESPTTMLQSSLLSINFPSLLQSPCRSTMRMKTLLPGHPKRIKSIPSRSHTRSPWTPMPSHSNSPPPFVGTRTNILSDILAETFNIGTTKSFPSFQR